MELLRLELTGRIGQVETPPGSPPNDVGLLGVDVSTMDLDGDEHVVVQALFDDDLPGFDGTMLTGPLVAELLGPDGSLVLRELFDHDRFRHDLRAERDAGIDDLRGVLVLTGGELPPHYIRLAFLPLGVGETAGTTLVLRRTESEALVSGVEVAHTRGEIDDDERRSLLVAIEQRHPT